MKISIKLKNNHNKVQRYQSKKTKRIYSILKKEEFKKAYIKVTYGSAFNDGEYTNYRDAKNALSAFTEKQLINDLESEALWQLNMKT